ncbi:MAG: nickel-dependent lactate racemase [Thermoplasmata archaeon]|nr:MAG: nickel-dependent lactate racemase [Thermoplasmata archaeon]
MKLEIPYGRDSVTIEISDKNLAGMVRPNVVDIGDEEETIKDAVNNPVNSKDFNEFLGDAEDVLFIVNDATRPTPTSKILGIIYGDIKDKNIRFIIATGVHRAPTDEEMEFIFGRYLNEFKERIHIHDARKEEDMVHIGTSKNGTEMFVNRMGVEAHKIVIISSVEPHYFGGYTGGRKSFLPGIASYKTIEQNHKYAMRKEAQPLVLEGNPVAEDMEDAIKTILDKEIFSIMTVLDRHQNIYAATAGHIHDSFHAAVAKANEVFAVEIEEKADIVVSVAPFPMDVDLYQSQKAIENAKMAVKEGGIIILVSKCREGIGEDAFYKLLSSSRDPHQVMDTIDKGYKLGYHKAARIVEASLVGELWAVTCLPDEVIEKAFMKPYKTVQEAVDAALTREGEEAKILVLMDGSVTVPMLSTARRT